MLSNYIATRWWKKIGLSRKLSFSTKDSLLQCFFWTIGISFEPHLSDSRLSLTKLATFLTVIDDLYDDHGSVDELQLFTDSVRRFVNFLHSCSFEFGIHEQQTVFIAKAEQLY